MGIKSTSKRSTYRSNVKSRPLNQNGLEAQYQGLDISEVNIDHAGLAIIGRGGTNRRRSYVKTQKRYIVQNDPTVVVEIYEPTIDLVFNRGTNYHDDLRDFYHNLEITLTDASGTAKIYKFLKSGGTNGAVVGGRVQVDIQGGQYKHNLKNIITRLRSVILYSTGHGPTSFTTSSPFAVSKHPNCFVLRITLNSNVKGSSSIAYTGNTSNQINPAPTGWVAPEELQFWALEGTKTIEQDPEKFYEDVRTDHIQSANKRGHFVNGERTAYDSFLANSVFGTGLARYGWNNFNSDPPLRDILNNNLYDQSTGQYFKPPFWTLEKSEATVDWAIPQPDTLKVEIVPPGIDPSLNHPANLEAISKYWLPKGPQISLGGVTSAGSTIINEDQKITTIFPPHGLAVNTRKESDEVRIKSYPLREEVFDTYRSDHTWVEDPAWIAHEHHRTSSQSWTLLRSFVSDHWGDKLIKFNSVPADGTKLYINSSLISTLRDTPNPLEIRFSSSFTGVHTTFQINNAVAKVSIVNNNTVDLVASAVATILNNYAPPQWTNSYPGSEFYSTQAEGDTVRVFYRAMLDADQNIPFSAFHNSMKAMDLQITQSTGNISVEVINGMENGIKKVLDHIYTPNPYHKNMHEEMSGRCDVFHRVERALELHNILIYERHKASVFDQYLDPHIDYINIYESQFPKQDYLSGELAFEDLRGKRKSLGPQWETQLNLITNLYEDIANSENLLSEWNPDETDDQPILFIDYFDQEPLKTHKYIEDERYTRIDDDMMAVLVKYTKRGQTGPLNILLDRREFQESDYISTGTGFINSTTTGQDGIVYREMLR